MPTAFCRAWLLVLACVIFLEPLASQESPPVEQPTPWPPQVHPWGTFQPGAWKLVRIVTESFNEQGTLVATNLSDSKTTLVGHDADAITLEVEVRVEVGGRRLNGPPQSVLQGTHGETLAPTLIVKEPSSDQVEIEDRKIPCQVRQVESAGPTGKTVATLHYSQNVAPYLLKRQSVTTAPEGDQVQSETTVTVLALAMPVKLQGALHSAAHVKTVQKTPQGTVLTLAVICPEIPGGIVSHTSKELDSAGRLVRRSTLELIDYGIEPEPPPPGRFNRRRGGRYRVR